MSFSLDDMTIGGNDDLLGDLLDKVAVARQRDHLHRFSGHALERLEVGASNMPVPFIINKHFVFEAA